jgi:hypothetical protein
VLLGFGHFCVQRRLSYPFPFFKGVSTLTPTQWDIVGRNRTLGAWQIQANSGILDATGYNGTMFSQLKIRFRVTGVRVRVPLALLKNSRSTPSNRRFSLPKNTMSYVRAARSPVATSQSSSLSRLEV